VESGELDVHEILKYYGKRDGHAICYKDNLEHQTWDLLQPLAVVPRPLCLLPLKGSKINLAGANESNTDVFLYTNLTSVFCPSVSMFVQPFGSTCTQYQSSLLAFCFGEGSMSKNIRMHTIVQRTRDSGSTSVSLMRVALPCFEIILSSQLRDYIKFGADFGLPISWGFAGFRVVAIHLISLMWLE